LRKSDRDSRELCADSTIGARIQRDDRSANRPSLGKSDRSRILKSIAGLGRERGRLGKSTEGELKQIAAWDALCVARARYHNRRDRGEVQATHGLEHIPPNCAGQAWQLPSAQRGMYIMRVLYADITPSLTPFSGARTSSRCLTQLRAS
jgi:hypothetical protein